MERDVAKEAALDRKSTKRLVREGDFAATCAPARLRPAFQLLRWAFQKIVDIGFARRIRHCPCKPTLDARAIWFLERPELLLGSHLAVQSHSGIYFVSGSEILDAPARECVRRRPSGSGCDSTVPLGMRP